MRQLSIVSLCLSVLLACTSDPSADDLDEPGDQPTDPTPDPDPLPSVQGACLVTVTSTAGVSTYDFNELGQLVLADLPSLQPIEYDWSIGSSSVTYWPYDDEGSIVREYAVASDDHWIVLDELTFEIGFGLQENKSEYMYANDQLVRVDQVSKASQTEVYQAVYSYDGDNLVSIFHTMFETTTREETFDYDNDDHLERIVGDDFSPDRLIDTDAAGKPKRVTYLDSGAVETLNYVGDGCDVEAKSWLLGLPSTNETW